MMAEENPPRVDYHHQKTLGERRVIIIVIIIT